MKMVKSLLLGSAAGLVAVVGAQAADLPVKAKPVEYVKVCSLYGAGFWYVPGTDTCLKVGSYVRVQSEYGANGGGIPIGAASGGSNGIFTRTTTNDYAFRTRSALSIDLRTQTEYGTLRSYLEVGAQQTTPNDATEAVFFDRGFIQFAGLTAGRIRSFFDINSMAPYSYGNTRVSGDTGAAGIYGIGYTMQFGNGFSGTLSIEDGGASSAGTTAGGGRNHMASDMTQAGSWSVGNTAATYDNKGFEFPDVVGALRVDQAWGYAQISAAAHDTSAGYYNTANNTLNNHPADKWGWAGTIGFTLKNVLGLQGDDFAMQAAYSQGATGYVTRSTASWVQYKAGNQVGLGFTTDGIFTNGTGIELTEAWGINAAYQHIWSPNWRSSLYGGYIDINYNANATAIICGAPVAVVTGVGGTAFGGNCNPDHSWYQLGTRTQWNPHPDLDIGLDLLWTHHNTAFKGTTPTLTGTTGLVAGTISPRPTGVYTVVDTDVYSAMVRIQRNFLP